MMAMVALAAGCGEGIQGASATLEYVADNRNGPQDPILATEGTTDTNRPVPTSMQTDAETARIASDAWRAAFHGECPRALDALDTISTRDPAYFAYLALDPTFDACRQ
jgi:hypothetical protein